MGKVIVPVTFCGLRQRSASDFFPGLVALVMLAIWLLWLVFLGLSGSGTAVMVNHTVIPRRIMFFLYVPLPGLQLLTRWHDSRQNWYLLVYNLPGPSDSGRGLQGEGKYPCGPQKNTFNGGLGAGPHLNQNKKFLRLYGWPGAV